MSTLMLITIILAIMMIAETLLGFSRRLLMMTVGARVDTKLNLQVFRRLLNLPLDYFERNQAGVITHHIMEVNKIRQFLTGRLLALLLDCITLFVLLPVLFMIQPTLTWLVVICGGLIAVTIMAFLGPVSRAIGRHISPRRRSRAC